jgi:hypothetical protein
MFPFPYATALYFLKALENPYRQPDQWSIALDAFHLVAAYRVCWGTLSFPRGRWMTDFILFYWFSPGQRRHECFVFRDWKVLDCIS